MPKFFSASRISTSMLRGMPDVYVPQDSNLIEVPAFGLQLGMYVAELDRPRLETPFAMQGFLIQDQSDIEYVSKHCTYVYVDPHRKVPITDLQKHKEQQQEAEMMKKAAHQQVMEAEKIYNKEKENQNKAKKDKVETADEESKE